jgi:uncharacterized SAM-binding protein YcdF (DUF218 family)
VTRAAEPLDAIVLLGCRVVPDGSQRGAARRRSERAAAAYAAGVSPLLVVSGGKRWSGVAEANALARALVAQGVPESALLLELRSRTTRGNAHHVGRLLEARGAKRLALVTCDWHMPRARAVFAREGFEITELPAPSPHIGLARSLRLLREHGSRLLDRLMPYEWVP